MAVAANGNGYARIGVWASVISAGALVVGAFIWIGGIAQDVRGNTEKIKQEEDRMNRLSSAVQSLQIQVSTEHANDCQQFAKVEGQVAAVQEILNETHVYELRFEDTVNQKMFNIAPSGKYHELTIEHTILPC